jgi:uncharacterized membrane protein (DUF106 family)
VISSVIIFLIINKWQKEVLKELLKDQENTEFQNTADEYQENLEKVLKNQDVERLVEERLV